MLVVYFVLCPRCVTALQISTTSIDELLVTADHPLSLALTWLLVSCASLLSTAVALLGVASIARVHTTELAAPATHITRTPSRVPEIPIYGMGYNDRCTLSPVLISLTRSLSHTATPELP